MAPLSDESAQALAESHPCFSEAAREHHGRIHLAVAPQCNLGCRYCERWVGPASQGKAGPGTAERILSPREAADLVDATESSGWLRVVGVAGPGEPLANPATLESFRLIHDSHPSLLLCLSTNGLELQARLNALLEVGVQSVTVTINATDPETASQVYDWAQIDGTRIPAAACADAVLDRQWNGLAAAVNAGLLVKVNSVFIPDINERDLVEVARRAGSIGAHRHNIMPLIPRGRMRDKRAPKRSELTKAQDKCEKWIPQFRGCSQCRADVIEPPLCVQGGLSCCAHT